MANFRVSLRPYVQQRAFHAPQRLVRRFGRRQVVLGAFKDDACSARYFPVYVYAHVMVSIRRLVRSSVRASVSSRIRRRAVGPIVLTGTFLAVPRQVQVPPLEGSFTVRVRRRRVSNVRRVGRDQAQVYLPYLGSPGDFQVNFLRNFRCEDSNLHRICPFYITSLVR